ncbi:uncharacterized protein wu:fj16a03 [Lampris incognitus]|uniref:uncharacterized protein wu:fj16a03 n=1 Tax=Lampris incognitus TaxID=2546036 RepID=UPI0024B4FAF0|nr:uncharacterized protein wu:fj16a03 [Lampris incognitus]
MKAYLLLLALLPLCTGREYYIECHGEDFLMVRNQLLQCSASVKQACYTRDSGEKGCTRLDFCKLPGWTCCDEDRCNV